MKTLMNTLMKGLAGFVFVALLAVNVQIGNSNGLLDIGKSTISEAKAKCPPAYDWCAIYQYPDGTTLIEVGQPIIITPDE
jgi:hypothetical protein